MGYPPSSRRMGDKKRYYYNSNPSRRGGNPYIKHKYGKPFTNPNSSGTSTSPSNLGGTSMGKPALYPKEGHIPSSGNPTGFVSSNLPASNSVRTVISSSPSSHTQETSLSNPFKNDGHRQSRYNGITSNNSSTVLGRSTPSRYNPDAELPTTISSLSSSTNSRSNDYSPHYRNKISAASGSLSATMGVSTPNKTKQHHHYNHPPYDSKESKFSPPSKSRFEKTRHSSGSLASLSSISNPNMTPIASVTSTNSPVPSSSRYNVSQYSTSNNSSYHPFHSNNNPKYSSSRYRPRVMETSVNSTPLGTTDSNNTTNTSDISQRSINERSISSTHKYDNGNVNFINRSHSKWRTSQNVSDNSNSQELDHENLQPTSNDSIKENITTSTSKITPSAVTHPHRSRYNSNVGSLDYSEMSHSHTHKTESKKEQAESREANKTYNGENKSDTHVTLPRNSINETSLLKRNSSVPSSQPRLIHSVVQTTREVEKQVSLDHKRIDLSRRNSDLNISHIHVPTEKSNDDLSRDKETDNDSDDNTKLKQSKFSQKRPDLKTMWTSSELNMKALLENHRNEKKSVNDTNKDIYSETSTGIDNDDDDVEMKDDEDIKNKEETEEPLNLKKDQYFTDDEYEYVSDIKLLKTPIHKLQSYVDYTTPLPEPLTPLEEYIFPMKEVNLKLWILKNQTRSSIITNQKYLLKSPVKSLFEYSFFTQNMNNHNQKINSTLVKVLRKLKKKELLKTLRLKQRANTLKTKWVEESKHLYEITAELRKDEIEYKKKQEQKAKEAEENAKNQGEYDPKTGTTVNASPGVSSRRRNRADFVDDTEMEDILLQIDPEYKHLQAAAPIPPLSLDIIDRHITEFKNVNNLVTDKDKWASRILFDKDDNFTKNEHELFIEGYLMFPKKFGKVSHHMGGLRTPEECVLHYYRTKKSVNYKKLLLDKSKKRKESIAKRRKKKEKEHEHIVSTPVVVTPVTVEQVKTSSIEGVNEKNDKFGPELPVKIVTEMPVEDKKIVTEPTATLPEELTTKPAEVSSNGINIEKNDVNNKTTEKQENKKEDTIEDIADDELIAIATAATSSKDIIKQIPVLEKSDTIDEEAHNTIEMTSTTIDNIEPISSRDKKRPHEVAVLAESSFDARDDSPSVRSNTILPPSIGNVNVTQFLDNDTSKLNENRLSDDSSKNGDSSSKKKHKYMSDHKTSYWSVRESQIFPELLKIYGSQWSLISDNLTTKSTTMVRNYYQRNAAQHGWKTIVDDADFRRDRENVTTLHQTQFMFQRNSTGQIISVNTDVNNQSPTISNGIPSQQKPAMKFFDKPNTTVPSTAGTSQHNSFTDYGKDVFPNPPMDTLPQPRLPSIQLPSTANNERTKSNSTMKNDSNEHPTNTVSQVSIAPIQPQMPHPSSSVFDPIRGNIERHEIIGVRHGNDIAQRTEFPKVMAMPTTTTIEPNLGSTTTLRRFDDKILDINKRETTSKSISRSTHSDIRTSSISALLNPISHQTRHYGSNILGTTSANESMSRTTLTTQAYQTPVMYSNQYASVRSVQNSITPSIGAVSNTTPQIQGLVPQLQQQPHQSPPQVQFQPTKGQSQPAQPTQVPQIPRPITDFANDPLAALAAIASAPETLASILPPESKKE